MEELIKKWTKERDLHIRVCKEPLMYTKEEIANSASCAKVLSAILSDLNKIQNKLL